MHKMFTKIFQRKNKLESKEKIELFRKLIIEIDIKKYDQKEYAKIVNLIFQDVFRI